MSVEQQMLRMNRKRITDPLIDRSISEDKPYKHMDYVDHEGHYIRPSRISRFPELCVRMEQLLDAFADDCSMYISTTLGTTFAIGSAVHSWLQNDVYGPSGRLYGRWLNLLTEELVEGFMPSTEYIRDQSRIRLWQYIEPSIHVEDLRLRGSCDGLYVDPTTGEVILLEFKTIRSDLFAKLNAPVDHHIMQANLYAANEFVKHTDLKFKKVKKILFVYVNKDSSAIKEFLVDAVGTMPDFIPQAISTYKENSQKMLLTPRLTGCSSKKEGRASNCDACDVCFRVGIERDYKKAMEKKYASQ